MDSVGGNKPQEVKEPTGKRRDLSNHPNEYKTIGVAGKMNNITSDSYNAYVFIGDEMKSTQFKIPYIKFVCPMQKTLRT